MTERWRDVAHIGHAELLTPTPEALTRRVEWLEAAGISGGWVEPEAGKGPAYEFTDPPPVTETS